MNVKTNRVTVGDKLRPTTGVFSGEIMGRICLGTHWTMEQAPTNYRMHYIIFYDLFWSQVISFRVRMAKTTCCGRRNCSVWCHKFEYNLFVYGARMLAAYYKQLLNLKYSFNQKKILSWINLREIEWLFSKLIFWKLFFCFSTKMKNSCSLTLRRIFNYNLNPCSESTSRN